MSAAIALGTTIERSAASILVRAERAGSLLGKVQLDAARTGGANSLPLLDAAAQQLQRAIPRLERAYGAVYGSMDFQELGMMGAGIRDALGGIDRARAIIRSGEGNLFSAAFGASQMLGVTRHSARMLLPVA